MPKYFLGLEIACSRARILICQRKYALELPTDAGYLGCRSISVPMEQSVKPSELDGDSLEDPAPYRRIIGQLIYLNITRPDLSYSVNILSQYMSVPRTTHCGAALRVLRYIKGCLGQGLFRQQKQRCGLKAFADFDWASCPDTWRWISGHCVLLGSFLLSWQPKKQSVVSCSTTEAEHHAVAQVTCKIVWTRSLPLCVREALQRCYQAFARGNS